MNRCTVLFAASTTVLMLLVAGGIGACTQPSRTPSSESELATVDHPTDAVVATHAVDSDCQRTSEPLGIPGDGPPRMLELTAVDVFGNPIADALVTLSSSGLILARTGRDGMARIGPIYTATIDLVVSAEKFEPTPVRALPLVRDLEQVEVGLWRTYSVRVRVVDSNGRAVIVDELYAIAAEANVVGIVSRCPDEPCFLVDNLPPEPFRLVAHVMGVVLYSRHDPRDPEAVIQVPEHGSVLIEFSEPIASPSQCHVFLRSTRVATEWAADQYTIFRGVSGEPPVDSFELPIVFVGRYSVDLYETNATTGREHGGGRTENVVVRAGERTVVRVPVVH